MKNPMQTFTATQTDCGQNPAGEEVTACVPWAEDCLFDLTNDPCETNNLAAVFPRILVRLQDKLKAYNATAVPANNVATDPKSKPSLWDDWWVPWQDSNPEPETVAFAPFSLSSSY